MSRIREVMTADPITLPSTGSISDAAKLMKAQDIGDVIVMKDDVAYGIVTDRDIAVRVVAEGLDPTSTRLVDVCSHRLTTLSPDEDVGNAVNLMRQRAIRRLPIVEGGQAVGIVSLGDLAEERDPESVLADISTAPANQ